MANGDSSREVPKEAASLKKKQTRFAKRLIDGLHGEAWRACHSLVESSEELRVVDAYEKVFATLHSIHKVGVIKANEAFDISFKKSYRKRAAQAWAELQDVADKVEMSDSLQAYFLLENVGLSRDDRRQILPANQSNYSVEGIEKALRVSFYDIHDRERGAGHREQAGGKRSGKGFRKHYAHVAQGESDGSGHKDEDDAAEDDAAYAIVAGEGETHEGTGGSDIGASEDDEIYDAFSAYQESRRKLKDFQKIKPGGAEASHPQGEVEDKVCGHWTGDGKALYVNENPCFFTLQDGDSNSYCDMVREGGAADMEQDDGREWEVMSEIPPPYVGEASAAEMPMPMPDRTQPDAEDVGPRDLRTSGPGQCDRWEAAVSGAKAQLIERLQKLYRGELVHKKGCSKKMDGGYLYDGSFGVLSLNAYVDDGGYLFGGAKVPETKMAGGYEGKGTVDPRSGLEIFKELVVGEMAPQISCLVCQCPLVLRSRRGKTGYFFGCKNFASEKHCKFTLELGEGLALYRHSEFVFAQDGHAEEIEEDERGLCLLDTACASCLHSRKWRQRFEALLPEDKRGQPTMQKQSFDFANGDSAKENITVWRLPVFFANIPEEVYSSELPDGETPLLFSIQAMRDDSGHESQEGEPSSGAGHGDHSDKALGHKSGPDFEKPMAEPKGTSEAPQVETEDLSVYYLQEAELPLLHGVNKKDKTAELSARRVRELEKSCRKQAALDQRNWTALKNNYALAEQWDGEGKFILGDQCPYGKWDYKIGRPVQKKTGWLSNSEVILRKARDGVDDDGDKMMNSEPKEPRVEPMEDTWEFAGVWWKMNGSMHGRVEQKMDSAWTGNTEFEILGGVPATEDHQEHHEGIRLSQWILITKNHERGVQKYQRHAECNDDEAVLDLLEHTAVGAERDLGRSWVALESGRADATLILCSLTARRMKKPQPLASPLDVPLRKSFLLLNGNEVLTTDFEEWRSMAPAAQVRPLWRKAVCSTSSSTGGDESAAVATHRVHVNLEHTPTAALLRALRVSRASETALKAARLFRCPDCLRMNEKAPRPSKLPMADEFNVQIGVDIIQEKGASGFNWTWLNVFDQGVCFQVSVLLENTRANLTASEVPRAFAMAWQSFGRRPSQGPFPVGCYVFYFDAANKVRGPNCWRGIARVVGKEGSGAIWISRRDILIAVFPEHLSLAHDQEVEHWMIVGSILHSMCPTTTPISPIADNPDAEANEREAKRQRVLRDTEAAHYVTETCDAASAYEFHGYLVKKAKEHFALENGDRLQRPCRPPPGDEDLVFFTDAKAENGRAWIGGFLEMVPGCHGPWFSLEVTREWARWAFSKDSPNKVIAPLELLATLIAVKLWVPDSKERQVSRVAIRGYTDNQSNEALVKKAMTTKFPSTLVLLELAEELAFKSCEPGLTWIRREANQLADDLTNENFKEFCPEFRVPLKGGDVQWRVLYRLLEHANGFYQELLQFKQQGKAGPVKVRKSEKLRKLKPW
ncbi:GIP [Symbiodinium pilosum]|uniref:GIP protein n=1 Tax=Symbiodinium pilosum TaxID=2952 RepID=A0A812U116_SYMPI|nr:GIP [Symbiodinium pilosum]